MSTVGAASGDVDKEASRLQERHENDNNGCSSTQDIDLRQQCYINVGLKLQSFAIRIAEPLQNEITLRTTQGGGASYNGQRHTSNGSPKKSEHYPESEISLGEDLGGQR